MGELAEVNTLHRHRTTEYAPEALAEMEEVFSALAGRLFTRAYHLENLEETQLAERYRQLLDTDKIDDCLQKLRFLAEDLQQGQRIEVDFAVRAVAVIVPELVRLLVSPYGVAPSAIAAEKGRSHKKISKGAMGKRW